MVASGWTGIFKRRPTFKTESVKFEISGYLGGRKALMKDIIELYYGKCRFQQFWEIDPY